MLALDISIEAVRMAGENARTNGVAADGSAIGGVVVAKASLEEVLAGRYGDAWRQAPLVVANILAHIILQLFNAGLADMVAPGGLLVASCILDSQAYLVNAALREHGLEVAGQEHIEDWVALIARKGTS